MKCYDQISQERHKSITLKCGCLISQCFYCSLSTPIRGIATQTPQDQIIVGGVQGHLQIPDPMSTHSSLGFETLHVSQPTTHAKRFKTTSHQHMLVKLNVYTYIYSICKVIHHHHGSKKALSYYIAMPNMYSEWEWA
jgi:hypothetical protein